MFGVEMGEAMSFKIKVLSVLAAILFVAGAAGAAVVWTVSAQRPALNDLDQASSHLAETVTPLVHTVDPRCSLTFPKCSSG